MRTLLSFIFTLAAIVSFAQPKPQLAFTIKEKDIIPEGIAHDPKENAFYLSSINKRKIMKITANGKVTDFVTSGADGLMEVLGMKVDSEQKLWACNNNPEHDTSNFVSNIHVYDLKNKNLEKVITIKDGKQHLFNDVHFMSNGDTYVTDSKTGAVHVIRKGKTDAEEFLKAGSVYYPNGITATPDEKRILVNTASGLGIVGIDVATKEMKPLRHSKFLILGGDGLYRHNNTLIGIQNILFPESVMRFFPNSDWTSISKIEFVTANEPGFDIPTTGVIVGDTFYFIANSQLRALEKGKIKEPEKLQETLIMKIKLN
jgi:DNA-binding beta-propeller fold protein YncE